MVLKLSDNTTINLLQACYWRVTKPLLTGDAKTIEIVFPGETSLILSPEETGHFEQMLERMARPQLIQPAVGGLQLS